MKMTVSNYDFRREFLDIRPNNFSLMGLDCLFDYFEELEGDIGEEIELDVIAICCDYAEDTAEAIAENYSIDIDGCEDQDEIYSTVRDYLADEGAFVGGEWMDESGKYLIVYRQF